MLYLFYFLIYLYVKYPANIDAFKVKLAIYIVKFIYRSDYSVVLGLHDLQTQQLEIQKPFQLTPL